MIITEDLKIWRIFYLRFKSKPKQQDPTGFKNLLGLLISFIPPQLLLLQNDW